MYKRPGYLVIQNENYKWGVLNKDLSTLIPDHYDDLYFENISNGFQCIVKKNNKWGIIDSLEKKIVAIEYDEIRLINNFWAILQKGDKKYVYSTMNKKISPLDENICVKAFGEDLPQNVIQISNNGLVGVLNNLGQIVVEPKFHNIYRIILNNDRLNYYFSVSFKSKRGIIDQSGNEFIPTKYNSLTILNKPNSLNEAFIKATDYYNVLAFYNGKKISINLQDFFKPSLELTSFIFISRNKYGIYDYFNDKILAEPIYDKISNFSDSLLIINKEGKIGLMTIQGQILLEPKYHKIMDFRDGIALVMKDYKWGYINERFEEIIEVKYEKAYKFFKGKALVMLNGNCFYIDKSGQIIEECSG